MPRLIPLPIARRLRPAAGWVGARWVPRGSAVVLMYHRVAELTFDPWRLAVSPGWFDEHMAVLRKSFRPLSLTELADATAGGEVPPRAVVVTFDDGYRDVLEHAKPSLEAHGVPATVFVTSGYVDSGEEFWWHELERICFTRPSSAAEQAPASGPALIAGMSVDWGTPSDALYLELWKQLQVMPVEARRAALVELREAVGLARETEVNTMTRAELLALRAGGLVEVGAHTVTHPNLPTLSRAGQLDEIRTSRSQLEELLGEPVGSFSYPHGELTPETVECVREAGFDRACSSRPEAVRGAVERFTIPRRHVDNWRGDEFAWQLSRFFRDR